MLISALCHRCQTPQKTMNFLRLRDICISQFNNIAYLITNKNGVSFTSKLQDNCTTWFSRNYCDTTFLLGLLNFTFSIKCQDKIITCYYLMNNTLASRLSQIFGNSLSLVHNYNFPVCSKWSLLEKNRPETRSTTTFMHFPCCSWYMS